MASYGWSYLVVTHALDTEVWEASDEGAFSTEAEMFRELGVTGWELVTARESQGKLIYYFKRSRA